MSEDYRFVCQFNNPFVPRVIEIICGLLLKDKLMVQHFGEVYSLNSFISHISYLTMNATEELFHTSPRRVSVHC